VPNIQSSRSRGFTLIEVLVVVAIIALLIAILLPSLVRARAQARAAACGSNVRQFGVAANMFAVEHKGRIPRGGNVTTVNWTQLVVKMLGDRRSYRENVNLVPVEKFGVFQCPDRSNTHPGEFLDYVVNALDHRGPLDGNCNGFPSAPTVLQNGQWYEAQGVVKLDVWDRPSEAAYIVDAADENTENIDFVLRDARVNINTNRNTVPGPGTPSLDYYDVWRGGLLPAYQQDITMTDPPRSSLKMHMNIGTQASFADGHAELLKPPTRSPSVAVDKELVYRYYLKKFGVFQARNITLPTPGAVQISRTGAGTSNCAMGEPNYSQ
jgi:prepilin-type N-terminal cleavage/methylation domain-containing protein